MTYKQKEYFVSAHGVRRRISHSVVADRPVGHTRTPRNVLGRTMYVSTVHDVADVSSILKPGSYSPKLGDKIAKGEEKGRRIYSLALEERATCPTTCLQWNTCYGNNSPYIHRINHLDPAFLPALRKELTSLTAKRRIAIRLHTLGDFYSKEYVGFWQEACGVLGDAIFLFGFTAWPPNSDIFRAVDLLNRTNRNVNIRYSGINTEAVKTKEEANGIVCPAQTGATDCCGTCALCWQSDALISFIEH